MFIYVAAASIVLGLTAVGAIYIGKWIAFNAKVIGEKSKVINDYNTSLANIPKLSSAVEALTVNTDLESVARTRAAICETIEGGVATTLESLRECTALRVIPDALPATRNPEALLASLNQIFLIAGTSPDSLAPSDTNSASPVRNVSNIPITLSISGSLTLASSVLDNIERSIRTFEMGTITIEWRGTNTIQLRGQSSAFYTPDKTAELKVKEFCASDPCIKKAKK
jgi:hypothetical protein